MRKIFLTGGTGLIGFHLLRFLLKDGHFVIITTRNKRKAMSMMKEENLSFDQVSVIEVNFNDENARKRILHEIPNDIDSLIFNARNLENIKVGENGRISMNQFQNEFFLAAVLPYEITYSILETSNKLKDVIFIGSMYGTVAPSPSLYENFAMESPINYGVTKAAQIHLTKELAVRLAEMKIRCNCISYGGVEGRQNEAFVRRYSKLVPLGRMVKPEDLYPPVKFLIDNPSLLITGENIKVDGGWTIW